MVLRSFVSLGLLTFFAAPAFCQQGVKPSPSMEDSLAYIKEVPISTFLTNVITKSTPTSIKSNFSEVDLANSGRSAGIGTNQLLPDQASAIGKGYTVRTVEFDPRFIKNIEKVGPKIGFALYPQFQSVGDISANFAQAISKEAVFSGSSGIGNLSALNPIAPVALSPSPSFETATTRIWGGIAISAPDPFPDSVAVVGGTAPNITLCSGDLIASDLVLTAGHCFCAGVDEVRTGITAYQPLETIKVVKEQSFSFKPCNALKSDYGIGDIALLKLASPVKEAARPIGGLPMVLNAAAVRAVGFGQSNQNGLTTATAGFKFQVNIGIASWQCNGDQYNGIPDAQVYRCQPAYELVAAALNRDTCAGDSGGPIYVQAEDTKTYVVGVTSRSVDPKGACGPGGIYVLLGVPPISDWLKSHGVSIFNGG